MTVPAGWPRVWDDDGRLRPVIDVLPDLDHWPDVTRMDQRESTCAAPDLG